MDEFTRGYLECMLWSSLMLDQEYDCNPPMDDFWDVDSLSPSTVREAQEDCDDFRRLVKWDEIEKDGNDDYRGGHDFWLTREGHGAGFWDGDWPTNGDMLSEHAETYGGHIPEEAWYRPEGMEDV